MSQTGSEFCHFIHLIHALASEEVQTIKILLILREEQLLLRLLNADDGLEDGALTVLNPLSHGVEVSGEVDRSGEDTLLVLTLRLTIELLPPLTHKVELGLEVHHDLNLLTVLVETIAHSCILGCGVLCERHIGSAGLLHILGTSYEFLDVETCTGDRQ